MTLRQILMQVCMHELLYATTPEEGPVLFVQIIHPAAAGDGRSEYMEKSQLGLFVFFQKAKQWGTLMLLQEITIYVTWAGSHQSLRQRSHLVIVSRNMS